MDWIQFTILMLTMIGIMAGSAWITWSFRVEARDDWKHTDQKMDAAREEMRDFHGRLCAIESKGWEMLERKIEEFRK